MVQLENAFLRALLSESDEAILAAAQAMDDARRRYPQLPAFDEQQQKRIALAAARKQTMEQLRGVLQYGSLAEIESLARSGLIAKWQLTADEALRVDAACQLMEAYRTSNDEMIESVYKQIYNAGLVRTLSEKDFSEIIDPARQRRTALERLQKALHDGSSPHQIMNAFNTCITVMGRFPPISEMETELIAHAKRFVEASDANDDDQMVAAYDTVKQSPYKDLMTFSEKERERVDSARLIMQTMVVARQTIVATYLSAQNTLNISLDLLKRVCIIKGLSFRAKLNELQQAQILTDTDGKQRIEAIRQQWEAELDSQYRAFYALEDLLADALIREKGPLEGNDTYEQQQQMLLDDFKRIATFDYTL